MEPASGWLSIERFDGFFKIVLLWLDGILLRTTPLSVMSGIAAAVTAAIAAAPPSAALLPRDAIDGCGQTEIERVSILAQSSFSWDRGDKDEVSQELSTSGSQL